MQFAKKLIKEWIKSYKPGDAIVGLQYQNKTLLTSVGISKPDKLSHTRIGSITKTMITTLLLQQVERGKLSLDDPIGKWIKKNIPNPTATLRNLVNMTSGIPDFSENPKFQNIIIKHPKIKFTPREILKYIPQEPEFSPGSSWNYSNTNTILIGFVLEKVTGLSIAELLLKYITNPLDLKGTIFPNESNSIPKPYLQGHTIISNNTNIIKGEEKNEKKITIENTTNWNPSWSWSAGEIISTVPDLLIWVKALATGKNILGRTLQSERLTSFLYNLPPNNSQRAYGLGIGIVEFPLGSNIKWIGHEGDIPGYDTLILHNLQYDTSIVITVGIDTMDSKNRSPSRILFEKLITLWWIPLITNVGSAPYPPSPVT